MINALRAKGALPGHVGSDVWISICDTRNLIHVQLSIAPMKHHLRTMWKTLEKSWAPENLRSQFLVKNSEYR